MNMPDHQPSPDVLALLRAALALQQLSLGTVWLAYFSLGGDADAFDLDAHIHELNPLPGIDQWILEQACRDALNFLL